MILYVVMYIDYGECFLEGIFSTRKKAEIYINSLDKRYAENVVIKEEVLNS